jgi:predicted ATPase
MALSLSMQRLQSRWQSGTGWPRRLNWLKIKNLRGWAGQQFDCRFPIMAVVGENGSGKSTVLHAAASVYQAEDDQAQSFYAFQFFPDTTWEKVTDAEIEWEVEEYKKRHAGGLRRPKPRWRGNKSRRKRHVEYIALSRIQPVSERVGYARLAKPQLEEQSSTDFDATRLKQFGRIMAREYDVARFATLSGSQLEVPVLGQRGTPYSGFHQGGGETVIAELLRRDIPKYALVLIDEIETSLHPRAQRRLIHFLADRCRDMEWQVILTTHSPFVLDELPSEARAQILVGEKGERRVFYGVSPEFAMTKIDDVQQYECDVFVEDSRSAIWLSEILTKCAPGAAPKCRMIPSGSSQVLKSLGQMVEKFPRKSLVYLDGDQGRWIGCQSLPGEDCPERVVFSGLRDINWGELHLRLGRYFSDVADNCSHAMSFQNPHDWVRHAASALQLGGDALWTTMCAEWSAKCLSELDGKDVTNPVLDSVSPDPTPSVSTAPGLPFEQSLFDPVS